MLQVENPVVLDLPVHNPPDYDSKAYWYFHADDGSDAQDETHYCLDLRKRLEEEKKSAELRRANGTKLAKNIFSGLSNIERSF